MRHANGERRVRVVYTALFGGYEELQDQPMATADDDTDYVCFTDRTDLTSDAWTIITIALPVPDDFVRSARWIKILGHPALTEYSESLWIDNRVILSTSPKRIFERWLGTGCAIAMPLHDHRPSVRDEFRAILASGFDDPGLVREQLARYEKIAPQVLEQPPMWTAIIARRREPRVDAAMESWFLEVARSSRRDQLSVNFATASLPDSLLNRVSLPNVSSDVHTWLSNVQLPKLSSIRYWDRSGYRYSLRMHLWDRVFGNRYTRYARWRVSNWRSQRW